MNKELEEYYGPNYIDESLICAGTTEGGKDSCNGDSGGPLVCQNAETGLYELQGVVSVGVEDCGRKGTAGVYAGVVGLYNLKWIQQVMKKEEEKTMKM